MSVPDLCIYDQDRRWVGGGPVLAGLSRTEAVERVARYAASRPADPTDPDDPRTLADGSRWVDAEALRRLVLSVAGEIKNADQGGTR